MTNKELEQEMRTEAREWLGLDPVNRKVARRLEHFADKLAALSSPSQPEQRIDKMNCGIPRIPNVWENAAVYAGKAPDCNTPPLRAEEADPPVSSPSHDWQPMKNDEKNHGAELIGQAIPDMAGTEPRLNREGELGLNVDMIDVDRLLNDRCDGRYEDGKRCCMFARHLGPCGEWPPKPEIGSSGRDSDTALLDWLEREALHSCAHATALRDSGPSLPEAVDTNSQQFRDGMRVQLFTVASQHVYGKDLRDAISRAMSIGSGNQASKEQAESTRRSEAQK